MTKTNQKYLTIPFHIFIFLIFLSHGVLSQTLQEQEQSVLLKLKQHWGNISFMDEWTPSDNSHCSWPGITCTSNSVKGLSLNNVNITGPVPSFICDLKNLATIDLGDNYIPGEFPRAVFNCSKLEALDLSENYFVGTLPDDIDKLAKLQSLVLGGNNFTGDIPPAIGKLQELKVLALGGNLFNGSLPPEIGDLSNLEDLWLANNNQLVPSRLPSSYTQLRKLTNLEVSSSNLIGEIPESIGDMEALEWLDLSRSDLHGKIPDGLFMLKNLSIVFLFKNKLSGDVPQVVEALNLKIIDLSENNLAGKIPEDFGKLTKLTGLALFSNQLSGSIPEGIGRLPVLVDFKLWDNNLTGVLPPDLGKYSNLREFQVSSNRLSGELPQHLCSNGQLVGVVAHENNFTGELPESLGNCNSLEMVKVSDNRLSGKVPSGLWTALNLSYVTMSNNLFNGTLPEKWSPILTRLEISNNNFSGNIPIGLASLRNLVVFKASNNLLTGAIPQELTTFHHLTNLFLDQNQLTGDLPSDIESWDSLNTLNLSGNQLSGQIPEKLGFLPTLTDLDLSENEFSGQIPPQLGLLRLIFLNLSSNDLSGTIPSALEIAVYANSFLNNPGLCSSNNVLQLKSCNPKSQNDNMSTPYLVLIIALSVAAFLLAVSFTFIIIRCYRSKHGLDPKWKLTSFQRLNFTESNIVSGLSDHNLIGSGGSGKVYRVPVNRLGNVVAVKRIWNNKKVEHKLEQEFLSEVKILSSILHTNIVKLLCCISSESSKLLVYEYLENRSLDRWLHNKNRQNMISAARSVHPGILDWPKRLQIAVGAAQGLCYMHHDCVPPVIHRDIKTSNILLDSDFNAKIADFGLARLLVKQGELATMSTVAGSFGYMAPALNLSYVTMSNNLFNGTLPEKWSTNLTRLEISNNRFSEYAHSTRVNEKIDVYSFGVVLLELATGREANSGDEHTSLAEWAWRHVQDDKPIEDALDEEIKDPIYVEEMSCVFKLGIYCTTTLPSTRPSMKDVLQLLLRHSRQMANGEKFVGTEYDAAPLLKNSKRERSLEDDDGIFASNV
ncbi:Receptor-like protein kinase HSL1 [Morus notabilis]|uniref:non-specific serine/threonine protein kinase n=1 Tax=Morus notabilis TaxID=981085 RepID=W9S6F2_9ROSA|nr:Receptor-like protein kinase HSL1 [Morus notabilis]